MEISLDQIPKIQSRGNIAASFASYICALTYFQSEAERLWELIHHQHY